MKADNTVGATETEPAHPTELYHAVNRLKEEHEVLTKTLLQLVERAEKVVYSRNGDYQLELLRGLRLETIQFMAMLEAHAVWEERILFPFLNDYFKMSDGPTILPSLWVLEKDHELAEAYLIFFKDSVEVLDYADDTAKNMNTAEYLIQACHILRDHLQMEEQFVSPLSEQVLTDIDYFFS